MLLRVVENFAVNNNDYPIQGQLKTENGIMKLHIIIGSAMLA